MIYKAKEGSKAYEYIRNILETEEKERNAYFNRVNEAVGFKVMKYGGYRQNGTINRILLFSFLTFNKIKNLPRE